MSASSTVTILYLLAEIEKLQSNFKQLYTDRELERDKYTVEIITLRSENKKLLEKIERVKNIVKSALDSDDNIYFSSIEKIEDLLED